MNLNKQAQISKQLAKNTSVNAVKNKRIKIKKRLWLPEKIQVVIGVFGTI